MEKTRTVTTTETYFVCDLCGEEVTTCNGNLASRGLDVDDVSNARGKVVAYVHRSMFQGKQSCVDKLVLEAISTRKLKGRRTSKSNG